jgi:hypothetical protein
MTPTLSAERKTEILEYLREERITDTTALRKGLRAVQIDPDTSEACLTEEMITDIIASQGPASPARRPKAKAKRTGKYKAHRVARSKEQWRVLTNYPNYEISSYGRVRSLQRTGAADWLKPRWFRGAPSVVLYDKDGHRRERLINWLMVSAGWLKQPTRKTAEEPVTA